MKEKDRDLRQRLKMFGLEWHVKRNKCIGDSSLILHSIASHIPSQEIRD